VTRGSNSNIPSAATLRKRSTTSTLNTSGDDSYAIDSASAITIELTAQRKRKIALANRILTTVPTANATHINLPSTEARRSGDDRASMSSIGNSSIDHTATESGSAHRAVLGITCNRLARNPSSFSRKEFIRLITFSSRFSSLLERVADMLAPVYQDLGRPHRGFVTDSCNGREADTTILSQTNAVPSLTVKRRALSLISASQSSSCARYAHARRKNHSMTICGRPSLAHPWSKN